MKQKTMESSEPSVIVYLWNGRLAARADLPSAHTDTDCGSHFGSHSMCVPARISGIGNV